jgi:uncharacterized damage-inducible protein DinB
MSSILAEFAESIFERLNHTLDGLDEEGLYWKPVEKSNSLYWILVHTTRIAILLIPQVLERSYNPKGWDDDFEQQKHSLEELKRDLTEAGKKIVDGIKKLDETQLSEEIMIWGSMRPLKEPLFVLLGELLHHNGQIAMLRGIYKRSNIC